jgi:hypothetical protein
MTRNAQTKFLAECIDELRRALDHLRFSANACEKIADSQPDLSEDQLILVEAFTSRFARVTDLLVRKVLRALDQVEWSESGTLLDVALRAEKRGLVDSVDWLREIKDLRNRISHDYAGDQLPDIFACCLAELPKLESTCRKVDSYSRDLLAKHR